MPRLATALALILAFFTLAGLIAWRFAKPVQDGEDESADALPTIDHDTLVRLVSEDCRRAYPGLAAAHAIGITEKGAQDHG